MLRNVRETLIVAALAVYVECSLRLTKLPQLTRRLGIRLDLASGVMSEPDGNYPYWSERSVDATFRVLRRWPWGDTCLRRCLILGHRLRGLDPVLRIGVRLSDDGALEAHSWLEINGRTLDVDAGKYSALTSSVET